MVIWAFFLGPNVKHAHTRVDITELGLDMKTRDQVYGVCWCKDPVKTTYTKKLI